MLWWMMAATAILGGLSAVWLERRIAVERRLLGMAEQKQPLTVVRPVLVTILMLLLAAWVMIAEGQGQSLTTPEVQPSATGQVARTGFHVILVVLLVLGTVIDLDCYLLPDAITVTGFVIGVLVAVTFQELQITHLWVDWAYARPQLQGPYIPAWYDAYRWGHALAWSLTGAVVGAAITQTVRWLSRRILGQEAMGMGDVTFMAMIGSFLGWQAVIIVFAVAPLTGLGFAIAGKFLANRPYLPYGPCLAAAAILVLLGWSRIWEQTRLMFSDLWGVALIALVALAALVVLLMGLRTYRQIPTGVSS